MSQIIKNPKNNGRKKKNENLGKKELAATARQRLPPPKKKNQNSEDPSGSIRDITAHLIHDKNTSITVSCTVFNFPSAGNDPGWIHWSHEFLFFNPRDFGRRGRHRQDPDVKIWLSKGLTPSLYTIFHGDFEKRH